MADENIKEDCGCGIWEMTKNGKTTRYIGYCPKHKAAPDMYEALKYIIRQLDQAGIIKADSLFMNMPQKALAKAE